MRYFSNLSTKDMKALAFLAFFLFCIVSYFGVKLSFDYQSSRRLELVKARGLLVSLYTYGQKVKHSQVVRINHSVEGGDQSLLSVASSTAKDKKLFFKRSQPEGDTQLKIWLEEANFNALLWWLSDIERKNGIQVQQISVEHSSKSGLVDARITLIR